MNIKHRQLASILLDPGSVSIKRIAWAFGCAKKDSEEEAELYKMLLAKVAEIESRRAG